MSSIIRAARARRATGLLLALVFLLASVVPVHAETIHRTWTGGVGSSSANGSARLERYLEGSGYLRLNLKALIANRDYNIEFRRGTCSALGTVLTTLFPFTSSATGTALVERNVPEGKMNTVWGYTRTRASLAMRITTSGSVKCSNLAYPRATKIVITALGISDAIIKPPSGYPPCNVAMYQPYLSQPSEPGVTMIYAHARTATFLPLLRRSKINNGASMIGMAVKVYTSNSKLHTYRIDRVRRHIRSIQDAFNVTAERLWIYTSEGPNFTYPKLIVEAHRTSTVNTTYAASHPVPRPIRC